MIMKMRGGKCTHSKGGRVKISLFAKQSRKKERDKGHNTFKSYLRLLCETLYMETVYI